MKMFQKCRCVRVSVLICAFAVLTCAAGCGKNTTPIAASPAEYNSGSYPATNNTDCLPDIKLTNQHSQQISLASLKGKPVLIDFIYANCATACPLLTSKFAAIAKVLGPQLGTKVTMVSITIDPEHDHPADLLKYAQTHAADYKGWLFLTGKPSDIDNVLSIFGLRRERASDGSIAHVATGFLIGADGKQARLYDALDVAPKTVAADVDRASARS
jgi:cytochrome oxidase Cu insertion factor (SCO1/SenC/PrrC family)